MKKEIIPDKNIEATITGIRNVAEDLKPYCAMLDEMVSNDDDANVRNILPYSQKIEIIIDQFSSV
jgi:hypothetical protein